MDTGIEPADPPPLGAPDPTQPTAADAGALTTASDARVDSGSDDDDDDDDSEESAERDRNRDDEEDAGTGDED
jgi:hypothetical protein